MTRDSLPVDILTVLLCLLFGQWIGWWGIVPAFAIGTAINIMTEKKGGK